MYWNYMQCSFEYRNLKWCFIFLYFTLWVESPRPVLSVMLLVNKVTDTSQSQHHLKFSIVKVSTLFSKKCWKTVHTSNNVLTYLEISPSPATHIQILQDNRLKGTLEHVIKTNSFTWTYSSSFGPWHQFTSKTAFYFLKWLDFNKKAKTNKQKWLNCCIAKCLEQLAYKNK